MKRPNEEQMEVLAYVRRQIQNRGTPPTVMEICRALGIADEERCEDLLDALECGGFITQDLSVKRGIALTRRGSVALTGEVAATADRILKSLGADYCRDLVAALSLRVGSGERA